MKILLVDGNSIVNRAFYAVPLLSDANGEYTNAVYGFLNIFFRFLKEEEPDCAVVAFDMPHPTFRHEMYAEYKGTRKGMPDELAAQMPLLKTMLAKMKVKTLEMPGIEADDILGTLAKRAEAEGFSVSVLSGDRDLLQIAAEKIKIRIPKTKAGKTEVEDYYADDVFALYGVTPTEYIDVKALMGDASDNIPGVPGIGEKTALKLITEYKSIEAAIESAWCIPQKKVSENLTAFAEQAILSKKLAAIDTNVAIDFIPDEFTTDDIFNSDAFEEVKRLGFRSFYPLFQTKKQAETPIATPKTPEKRALLLTGDNEITVFAGEMSQKDTVAYEIISNLEGILGCAFYDGVTAVFAYIGEREEGKFFALLASFFESKAKKLTFGAKDDINYLRGLGIEMNEITFDAYLAAYILNSSRSTYYFDDIARDYLNETCVSAAEFFGEKPSGAIGLDLNALADFAAKQAEVSFRAFPVMKKHLEDNNQYQLYFEIELPLVRVLADMERAGMKADAAELKRFGKELDVHIEELSKEIFGLAGEEFNIQSPKQTAVILFEKLSLPGGKKTKTGWSTAADVLEKLTEHEIVRKILDYRTYTKLKSTYVDGLLAVINPKTGKIHTTFNQTVASTGRLSSTEPNLQNIPVRTELGRSLRKVFIPDGEDTVYAAADYSQIELRVLAHISGDRKFIEAFKNNEDIHRLTASEVFGVPLTEVTNRQRSDAKAVNFGIVYGISAFALSEDLGISVKEAGNYIDGYFEKYPAVHEYLTASIASAKKLGYAETMLNRRRQIPELASSNFNTRSFGERVAMNMPIQGTAADIIKIAMIRVHERLVSEKLRSRIVLQVHDELILEVPKNELAHVSELLRFEMENAVTLSVPLLAEVKTGGSWYETK